MSKVLDEYFQLWYSKKIKLPIFSGTFPFPERNLMTAQDKSQFLPVIKTFAEVLEENGANAGKTNLLLQQSKKLAKLIPENLRNSIPSI